MSNDSETKLQSPNPDDGQKTGVFRTTVIRVSVTDLNALLFEREQLLAQVTLLQRTLSEAVLQKRADVKLIHELRTQLAEYQDTATQAVSVAREVVDGHRDCVSIVTD